MVIFSIFFEKMAAGWGWLLNTGCESNDVMRKEGGCRMQISDELRGRKKWQLVNEKGAIQSAVV